MILASNVIYVKSSKDSLIRRKDADFKGCRPWNKTQTMCSGKICYLLVIYSSTLWWKFFLSGISDISLHLGMGSVGKKKTERSNTHRISLACMFIICLAAYCSNVLPCHRGGCLLPVAAGGGGGVKTVSGEKAAGGGGAPQRLLCVSRRRSLEKYLVAIISLFIGMRGNDCLVIQQTANRAPWGNSLWLTVLIRN